MSCPNCPDSALRALTPGSCESELLDAVKSEFFKAVAALPPHLQRYLSCRLGLGTQAVPLAFDVGKLLAALPAILQLLMQLGLIRPPSASAPAPSPTEPPRDPADYSPRAVRRCA